MAKKVPKLKSLKDVNEKEWWRCIQKACNIVFHRLELQSHHAKRDSILSRIEEFNVSESQSPNAGDAHRYPCFLVQRENMTSKSPFQVQVSGARILAQKIIFASFRKLNANNMGTWQVRQKCLHPDGTWWCFEPTHLEKCQRDHVPSAVKKHALPFQPDAVYVARIRHARHTVAPNTPQTVNPPQTFPRGLSQAPPHLMPQQQVQQVQHAAQLSTHDAVLARQQAELVAQSRHREAAKLLQSKRDGHRPDSPNGRNGDKGPAERGVDPAAAAPAASDSPPETVTTSPATPVCVAPPRSAPGADALVAISADLVAQRAAARKANSTELLFKELT